MFLVGYQTVLMQFSNTVEANMRFFIINITFLEVSYWRFILLY